MTIVKTETQLFEDSVDRWVLDAIARGITTFDQLLASLPGVYPSVVLKSLQRLVSIQKIPTEVLADVVKPFKQRPEPPTHSYHQIALPVPHPREKTPTNWTREAKLWKKGQPH